MKNENLRRAFLQKRLHFFTGKGGVGKSSVAAAVAQWLSGQGKTVLLCELAHQSAMKDIFRVPFVGFEPLEVGERIWAINIDTTEALTEYVHQYVFSHTLAKMITENKVLRYFWRTSPAVNEVVITNKICNMVEKQDTLGYPIYDAVLVDLPATGHALTFLQITRMLQKLIPVGPLRKVSNRFQAILEDPKRTWLHIVTLLEEMPVNETVELYQALKEKVPIERGLLFINKTAPAFFTEQEEALLDDLESAAKENGGLPAALVAGRWSLNRQRTAIRHRDWLVRQVDLPVISLPLLDTNDFHAGDTRRLAEALDANLSDVAP